MASAPKANGATEQANASTVPTRRNARATATQKQTTMHKYNATTIGPWWKISFRREIVVLGSPMLLLQDTGGSDA